MIESPVTYTWPDGELFIDVSRYGIGLLEIDEGGISTINPENCYLVTDTNNIRQVNACVVFSEFKETKPGGEFSQFVKLTIHEPGTIRHLVYLLKDNKLKQKKDLADFPAYAALEVDADGYQTTGVEELLVLKVDNSLSSDRYYGRSDYTPTVHSLIEALDFAFARRAEVLAKFSRPIPQVPQNAMQFDHARQKWLFKTEDAIILQEGQPAASYMTWAASLADVDTEIKDLTEHLLMKLKISRVLLAGENAGQAESGTALKIRLVPTLAKVRAFATAYAALVPRLYSLKSKLDVVLGVPDAQAIEPEDVKVEMQDGIPDIPMELAQLRQIDATAIGTLKAQGVIDTKTALRASIRRGIIGPEDLVALEDANAEAAVMTAAANSETEGGM